MIAADLSRRHLGAAVAWGNAVCDIHELRHTDRYVVVLEYTEHGTVRWHMDIPPHAEITILNSQEEIPA